MEALLQVIDSPLFAPVSVAPFQIVFLKYYIHFLGNIILNDIFPIMRHTAAIHCQREERCHVAPTGALFLKQSPIVL